jgi:hypothetical protein
MLRLTSKLFSIQQVATCLVAVVATLAASIGDEPRPAFACSCAGLATPLEAVKHADSVFVGRVVGGGANLDQSDRTELPPLSQVRYTFDIISTLKGSHTPQITVLTGSGGGDCGVEFRIGSVWVVYGRSYDDNTYYTSICTRTSPLSYAGEDLRALGPGNPPLPDELLRESGITQEVLDRWRASSPLGIWSAPLERAVVALLIGGASSFGFIAWMRVRRRARQVQ